MISGAALRGAELESSRFPTPIYYSNQLSSPPYPSSQNKVPFDHGREDEHTLFGALAMVLRLATVGVAPEMTRSILDTSIELVGGQT